MRMSRFLPWFTSKNGKLFTRSCVGLASVAVFANQIAINGPLMGKVRDIFQVYNFTKPKPLPENANKLIEEVLQDSTLKEEEKKNLQFFYSVGLDLFHLGGITSPWGAMIGIPFTYEDRLNLSELRIQGRDSLDWVVDGPDLVRALKISDKARKFALMREIYSCNFFGVMQNALIGAFCVLFPGRIAQVMNTRLNTFEKFTFKRRCMFYGIFYACGFFLYRCLKDPLKHISNKEADKLAAQTSPEYLDGGIEYYNKELMQHKAMRELMEGRGRRMYDKNGNENYILFPPKLPTSKRIECLENLKKQNSNEKE